MCDARRGGKQVINTYEGHNAVLAIQDQLQLSVAYVTGRQSEQDDKDKYSVPRG